MKPQRRGGGTEGTMYAIVRMGKHKGRKRSSERRKDRKSILHFETEVKSLHTPTIESTSYMQCFQYRQTLLVTDHGAFVAVVCSDSKPQCALATSGGWMILLERGLHPPVLSGPTS